MAAIDQSVVPEHLSGISTVLLRPDGYIASVIERPLDEYFPTLELDQWMRTSGDIGAIGNSARSQSDADCWLASRSD
jgi:hypothetical protein